MQCFFFKLPVLQSITTWSVEPLLDYLEDMPHHCNLSFQDPESKGTMLILFTSGCRIPKATGLPAAIQNGLWRPFLPAALIHNQWTFFHCTGIIPGKARKL